VSDGLSPRQVAERFDHLQAEHPFRYNLVTGALVGLVLLALGFHGALVAAYVLSWACLRAFLWGDGRILRRQYELRVARVAEQEAARRRQR
jgi:streptomycin 6-kinase